MGISRGCCVAWKCEGKFGASVLRGFAWRVRDGVICLAGIFTMSQKLGKYDFYHGCLVSRETLHGDGSFFMDERWSLLSCLRTI